MHLGHGNCLMLRVGALVRLLRAQLVGCLLMASTWLPPATPTGQCSHCAGTPPSFTMSVSAPHADGVGGHAAEPAGGLLLQRVRLRAARLAVLPGPHQRCVGRQDSAGVAMGGLRAVEQSVRRPRCSSSLLCTALPLHVSVAPPTLPARRQVAQPGTWHEHARGEVNGRAGAISTSIFRRARCSAATHACHLTPFAPFSTLTIRTRLCLQVRQRLEAAKTRKEGGSSSAADFAPDGELMGWCAARHNRLALQA